MEQGNLGLLAVTELLRTPLGERVKHRVFRDMNTNTEILAYLRKQKEPYDRMMAYYRCAIMEVETKFRVLNQEFSLQHDRNPIESIKTRLKSVESITDKLARKDLEFSVSSIEQNINDIAGIRVVCAFPEDIYVLANCLLQQDDVTLIARKDYIKNPKPNGYRSLHLIISIPIFLLNEKREMRVEVQLRTIAMDFWASLEHRLRYKKTVEGDVDLQQIEQELKQCAEESVALDLRMEQIRKKLGA